MKKRLYKVEVAHPEVVECPTYYVAAAAIEEACSKAAHAAAKDTATAHGHWYCTSAQLVQQRFVP